MHTLPRPDRAARLVEEGQADTSIVRDLIGALPGLAIILVVLFAVAGGLLSVADPGLPGDLAGVVVGWVRHLVYSWIGGLISLVWAHAG